MLRLPSGVTLTFVGIGEWATFQVTQDPGKLLALAASVGIVGGLLLSLMVRRRRVWVRVRRRRRGHDYRGGRRPGPDGRRPVRG